jgi:hypothetical protein
VSTGWGLHDGIGTFGVVQFNPFNGRLSAALTELAEASIDLGSTTIHGRIRTRLARARLESVQRAHAKWQEENP